MKIKLLISAFILYPFFSIAQRACTSVEYYNKLKKIYPQLAQQQGSSFFNNPEIPSSPNHSSGTTGTEGTSPVINIPVVVHILSRNSTNWYISDDQVYSAITALNNDYRRQNADTIYTPDVFKPVAADMMIQFSLAKSTPDSRPTTGIVRKQTSRNTFSDDNNMKFSSSGGDDAWDSRYYLNIWVCNMGEASLGFASPPGVDPAIDGVVMNIYGFGTMGTVDPPFNLGRTLTHEVGHWLGLKHIWGDMSCGDDGIADTPPQSWGTTGCPSGTVISCNNAPNGDMYMNYMDYTEDACMNMFTKGQRDKARSLFAVGGLRNSILSSTGNNEPTKPPLPEESPADEVYKMITVSPNPTPGIINIHSGTESLMSGSDVLVFDNTGRQVLRFSNVQQGQPLSIASLSQGMYLLKCRLESGKWVVLKVIRN